MGEVVCCLWQVQVSEREVNRNRDLPTKPVGRLGFACCSFRASPTNISG